MDFFIVLKIIFKFFGEVILYVEGCTIVEYNSYVFIGEGGEFFIVRDGIFF